MWTKTSVSSQMENKTGTKICQISVFTLKPTSNAKSTLYEKHFVFS